MKLQSVTVLVFVFYSRNIPYMITGSSEPFIFYNLIWFFYFSYIFHCPSQECRLQNPIQSLNLSHWFKPVYRFTKQVMKSIEEDIGQDNPSAPANRSSQGYRQWLEELDKNAGGDRYLVTYVDQLRKYHVALEINNSSRMKDARKSLEKYFSKLDEGKFTAIDRKLKRSYSNAKDALEEYVQIHGEPHNPNLLELKKLIFKFEEDSRKESEYSSSQTKSKGIVFTRTRESTQALLGWIQETEQLSAILRPVIIVGSGGESM